MFIMSVNFWVLVPLIIKVLSCHNSSKSFWSVTKNIRPNFISSSFHRLLSRNSTSTRKAVVFADSTRSPLNDVQDNPPQQWTYLSVKLAPTYPSRRCFFCHYSHGFYLGKPDYITPSWHIPQRAIKNSVPHAPLHCQASDNLLDTTG